MTQLKKIICYEPKIMTIDNFLNPAQCEYIMKHDSVGFQRAMGYNMDAFESFVTEVRTNHTFFDSRNTFDYVRQEAFKLVKDFFWYLDGFSVDHLEYAQIQKYTVGQEYKPHYDYFYAAPYLVTNDRIATLIVYLNDGFSGGETEFPNLNIKITPKQGRALYFEYKYINKLNIKTLHAGLPVTEGEKWIITIWIRQDSYLQYPPRKLVMMENAVDNQETEANG